MTKPLEAHIAELQAVMDDPGGRYWSYTPAVSALIAALEQSQKQNADLQRDELAEAAAKELRRVENLYAESQKRVAELEQAKPHHNGFMHLSQELIEANSRITDLESQRQMAFMAGNRWADKFRESEARVAELESQNLIASSALFDAGKRIAELEAQDSSIKPFIKPHKFRECVNGLLEAAIAYAGTQQLRARLSDRLSNFVEPDHPHNRATGCAVKGGE